MSASARNKKQPKYEEYISYSGLVSMYNAIATMQHKDKRIVLTNLHLICEISMKKLSLYHGIPVSTTSHKIGGLIFSLSDLEPVIGAFIKEAISQGYMRKVQKFPYDELRFNEVVTKPLVSEIVLFNLAKALLHRLHYIEGGGF